jgi:RHH-type rel operon transcriptional repressor/antitoxin RelB
MAEMREITIVVDSEIDDELTAIAELTGRSKSTIAREALLDWLEDQEDIRDAMAVIVQGNPKISLEEVERILGLES